jgi:invasion protein IalB
MKIIPFSSIMEFQRESQKAVRGTGFAESAVWAVFAASTALSILLSLSQITPASAQSNAPKASSVVCDQQNIQPVCTVQNT